MKREFRNRVFLPVIVPVLILLSMVAFIGVFALTLLHGTHEMSLTLAVVAAGGILFTVSLATSQDRLDPVRRGVLGVAVATPLIVGALFATGLMGEIPEGARMIDVEPALEAPEDARLAAENANEFCLPDGDECEPTDLWSVGSQDAEEFIYLFENRDAGVPHNLSLRELEGDRDEPQPGEVLHEGEIITGEDESTEAASPGLEPGDYYFVCDVHSATMTGVLEVTEGGEGDGGGEGDEGGEGGEGDEGGEAAA